jgi:hypothetical protein
MAENVHVEECDGVHRKVLTGGNELSKCEKPTSSLRKMASNVVNF